MVAVEQVTVEQRRLAPDGAPAAAREVLQTE